jgi:hypothetical protein
MACMYAKVADAIEDNQRYHSKLGRDLWAAGRRPFSGNFDLARVRRRVVGLEPSRRRYPRAHGLLTFPFGYSKGGQSLERSHVVHSN